MSIDITMATALLLYIGFHRVYRPAKVFRRLEPPHPARILALFRLGISIAVPEWRDSESVQVANRPKTRRHDPGVQVRRLNRLLRRP